MGPSWSSPPLPMGRLLRPVRQLSCSPEDGSPPSFLHDLLKDLYQSLAMGWFSLTLTQVIKKIIAESAIDRAGALRGLTSSSVLHQPTTGSSLIIPRLLFCIRRSVHRVRVMSTQRKRGRAIIRFANVVFRARGFCFRGRPFITDRRYVAYGYHTHSTHGRYFFVVRHHVQGNS